MEKFASFRRWLLKTITPFNVWFGKVQAPETKMPDGTYEQIMTIVQDGDILLSHKEWSASNIGIPGFWKHATLFRKGEIIEAIGIGVRSESLARWLYTKDYVIVLRPTFCDSETCKKAAEFAASKKGLPYDYEFSPGIESFYCSELIFWAYDEAMGNSSPFVPKKIFGVDTIAPQDFANAKDKFITLFVIAPKKELK